MSEARKTPLRPGALANAFATFLFLQSGAAASADSLPRSGLTIQADPDLGRFKAHKDVFGKPCLTYEAISRAHIADPNVFDHIVSIDNHCHETIRVRICYENSDHCADLLILGGERKESVLGVQPMMPYFRYQAKEIYWPTDDPSFH